MPNKNSFVSDNPKRILIVGLCALPMGMMERQLGNMGILVPMIKLFQQELGNIEIHTSLQLSKDFCTRYNIVSVRHRSMYEPSLRSGVITGLDFIRTLLWKLIVKALRVNVRMLIRGRKIAEFLQAELVVDFSGDTFGSMGHALHLLKHAMELGTACNLGKAVIMYAQSPGPFPGVLRRLLASLVFHRMAVVTVRDPVTYTALQKYDPRVTAVRTACPAHLLTPASPSQVRTILRQEHIEPDRGALIGLTLTGWNFASKLTSSAKYKPRRTEQEIAPVFDVARFVLEKLGATLVLVPHVYRTDSAGGFIPGPDSKVTQQLYQMIRERIDSPKVALVSGIYSSAEIKGLIGQFDLHISGRLHAGVAALSQGVPTVFIAYGPKFYGFARLVGQESYVSNALGGTIDGRDLVEKVRAAWEQRDQIRRELKQGMPLVRELAALNTIVLKDLLELPEQARQRPPQELVARWGRLSNALFEGLGLSAGHKR